MAWHLFLENSWRVRVAGMGYVAGIDLQRIEDRLVGEGLPRPVAEDLLAACEVGFVKASNEKDEDGAQE